MTGGGGSPLRPKRRVYRFMKKTVKKLTAVGLTLTSVMGLVACGSNSGSSTSSSSSKEVTKPDKFTVMADSTIVTETNGAEAFYAYLKDLTGLDIEWKRPDHSGYYDAVANAFNSDDTMPDVVLLSSDYYALYASNGFLWNMTDAWANSETKKSGRLIDTAENVLSALMVNGEDGTQAMYGFSPYRGNGCCTYIKKAWLDKAGIDSSKLADIDKEIERLKKEEGKLHGEIKRCNGMLNNEKFVSKAPQAKIDEEKAKLEKYTQMLAQVQERLQTLAK